jgi:metal-responsive CopG/Arc/MetJ family transcriptional regulator
VVWYNCFKIEEGAMKTVQTKIPDKLYREAESLVREGWFRDEGELLSEALRRFLDTHRPELMEKFIRDDVEWGLHGKE